MSSLSDYQPPRFPENLLQKDWTKRKLHYRTDRLDYIRKVHDVEVWDDDVWLVTLPKCGTTWMQELLWLVLNGYDFETAKREHLEVRTPYMEFHYMIHGDLETCFQPIEQLKRPRLIKTHLSLPLLPHQLWDKKPKVVYVARNIKDALVSDYYHARNVGAAANKTLDEYVLAEIDGRKLHDPFLHMTEFYALRHEPWLFYTSFERMKLDLRQVIGEVCKFLEKTVDNVTMEEMLRHLSFEEMKKNPKTNHIWEFEQVRQKHGMGSGPMDYCSLFNVITCVPSTMWSLTDYQPPRFPVNLLQKDWTQRELCYFSDELEFIRKVHDADVFYDDVWLVTLPKCGTTWMQELLWLVLNGYNFETAKREHLEIRTPFLEFAYEIHRDLETCFRPLEQLKRPRLIKTHLCLPLLPHQVWDKKPKVIYVARNIKDALVSEYHHVRNIGFPMDKTLDEYVRGEIEDRQLFEPFLHMTEFYALRHEPWVFYTSFERMKLDLRQVIKDVCKFLEKTIDNETMEQMLRHLSFEEMKKNPKTNHIWEFEQLRQKYGLSCGGTEHNFIRKGQMNAYREELSEETIEKVDEWVEQNLKKYNVTLDELLLLGEHNN